MARAFRYDFAPTAGRPEKTDHGYLRIDGRLTRTGVLLYRDAAGNERREWRPPAEVFKLDSMRTVEDSPVTDLHPPVPVTPDNVKDFGKGVVKNVRADGRFLAARLLVQDQSLIAAIEAGDRAEISAGYSVDLVLEPGETPEGERYDAIQTNIKYNHFAAGPRNWGRAGNDVALRTDGKTFDGVDLAVAYRVDDKQPEPRTMETEVIRLDGVSYTVPKGQGDNLIAHFEKLQREKDEAIAKAAEETKRADSVQGELDATKTQLGDARDPKKVAALVQDRIDLVAKAKTIGGESIKLDGLSDHEIRIAAIVVKDPEFKADGRSEDYVSAVFNTLAKVDKAPADNAADARKAALKLDGKIASSADKRREMIEANRAAWKGGN